MNQRKVIGLVGGLTWISTADYYSKLCQRANDRNGGRFSPRILISSINLQEFTDNLDSSQHDQNIKLILGEAQKLENQGAECVAMCSNTPHIYAREIQSGLGIPLVHIAKATACSIQTMGRKCAIVFGTRSTMQADFYTEELGEYGIERLQIDDSDQDWVHHVVVEELVRNQFLDSTRVGFLHRIEKYTAMGADAAILGCTEIPALLNGHEAKVQMFDTLDIHCNAILNHAFGS